MPRLHWKKICNLCRYEISPGGVLPFAGMKAVCREFSSVGSPLKGDVPNVLLRRDPSSKMLIEQMRAPAEEPPERLWRGGRQVEWRQSTDYGESCSHPRKKQSHQGLVIRYELGGRRLRCDIVGAESCNQYVGGENILTLHELQGLAGIHTRPSYRLPAHGANEPIRNYFGSLIR